MSTVLSTDDPHTEFTMSIRLFLKEGQKVDPNLIILPVNGVDEEPIISMPDQAPLNQTDLQANVKLPCNASFEKCKPWGKKWEEVDEEDMQDPEVKFGLTIASDIHPEVICDRICAEWERNGGKKIFVKELRTHYPKHAVVLYEFYNKNNLETIVAEPEQLLTQARDAESLNAMGDFKWDGMDIPVMGCTS